MHPCIRQSLVVSRRHLQISCFLLGALVLLITIIGDYRCSLSFPSFSRCKQKSTVNGGWVKPLLTCRVSGASWFQDVSLGRWVKHWAVLWPTKTDIFVGTHLVSDICIYIYNYCICNLMYLQVCNLQKLFGMIIPADQKGHSSKKGNWGWIMGTCLSI